MTFSIAGAAVIVLVDFLLFVFGRFVMNSSTAQSQKGLSVILVLVLCGLAISIHLGAVIVANAFIKNGIVAGVASIFTGLPAAAMFGLLVRDSVSIRAVYFIFGGTEKQRSEINFARARRFIERGDIESAIREYRRLADANLESSEPLFALLSLLEHDCRHQEASDVCREIIGRFRADLVTWTEASRHLADILGEHLNDREAAEAVRKGIYERNPDARFGYVFVEAKPGGVGNIKHKTEYHAVHDMNQARRLAQRGEVDAAVGLFKRYAEEHPTEPRPLFEAATTLELAKRHSDAATVLQLIVRKFRENDDAWGEAHLRLATLHQMYFNDEEAARGLLLEIMKRNPRNKQGRIAGIRLQDLKRE